jgi:hypothetical protein
MSNFMSPLPTFTLESLVTDGQWTAAQNTNRKKTEAKPGPETQNKRNAEDTSKTAKPTL